MSAIVIPFEPRADEATAVAVPANSTAPIIEFPARPHSQTAGDIAALQALAPTPDGVWGCEILVKDDGDRWAVFEGHHASPLMFYVGRSGCRLRLLNMDEEIVLACAEVNAVPTICWAMPLGGDLSRQYEPAAHAHTSLAIAPPRRGPKPGFCNRAPLHCDMVPENHSARQDCYQDNSG